VDWGDENIRPRRPAHAEDTDVYAWMHFHDGLEQKFARNRWYDAVIPEEDDMELFGAEAGRALGAGAEQSGPMVSIGLAPELTPLAGQVRSGRVGPLLSVPATDGRGYGCTTANAFKFLARVAIPPRADYK
jgi:hypothetical protein